MPPAVAAAAGFDVGAGASDRGGVFIGDVKLLNLKATLAQARPVVFAGLLGFFGAGAERPLAAETRQR